MEFVIAAFVMVIDVICILDCLKSKREEPQKIIWVLGVIIVPILGALAYFLWGRQKS